MFRNLPLAEIKHARLVPALVVSLFLTATASAEPTQIQRGEYLARAGDCVSCHTAKQGEPFSGGDRLNTPFGYMLAPNITSDPDTGIGRWSADDFYRSMHDGVNRRGQDMYPTMPYDFYTNVTREDVDAIYAYLRTLKPVKNAIDVNHLRFPFDLRWSMAVWRELYFAAGTYRPDAAKSVAWNRGAYLVEGLGHCADCHSPRNLLGGIEKSKDFAGGPVDGWFAPDLTSDIVTGLRDWTVDEIATFLKTGAIKGKTPAAFGPMAEVVQNSTSYLTDADLNAMAEYLKSIPPESRLRTGLKTPDPTRQEGVKLYLEYCRDCHQAKGRGLSGIIPPLADNGTVNASDPVDIIKIVLSGTQRGDNLRIPMPSFETYLNDQQIADIVNYVRTSWGNKAVPDVTTSMVAKLRQTSSGGAR